MPEYTSNPDFKKIYGIEEHLKALSLSDENCAGMLYSLWIIHRKRISDLLGVTSSMFASYSDHGPKHSQALINSINLILGEERIKLLEATDAWMILECSYLHDIGMYVPYDDTIKYIRDGDYGTDLNNSKNSQDNDEKLAAHDLSNPDFPPKNSEVQEIAQNIIDHKKNLDLLLQKYFRKIHGDRSARYIMGNDKNIDPLKGKELDVQNRLWEAIATICSFHQQNRDDLFKLMPRCEQGFGTDIAHPRFIAELIRLGDLLDLDNNRFNPYMLALWGKLPLQAEAHILKHCGLTHLYISPTEIEITVTINLTDYEIDKFNKNGLVLDNKKYKFLENVNKLKKDLSDKSVFANIKIKETADKYIKKLNEQRWNLQEELLKSRQRRENKKIYADKLYLIFTVTADWLKWVEDEIKFFAVHWLDIVPENFTGNVPSLRKSEILWHGKVLNPKNVSMKYSISHARAASIILGSGLYGSVDQKRKRNVSFLDQYIFLREILQNAMDATKIQAYRYLRQARYGEAADFGNNIAEWNPIDITNAIGDYITNINIELRVYYNTYREDNEKEDKEKNEKMKNRLVFVIRDTGTGIDLETLQYMSKIGSNNLSLSKQTADMPEWLRPNGSFGIGMQSVFGIVEEFQAVSASRKDHVERDLYFKSAKFDGSLFVLEHNNEYDEQIIKYGTKIIIQLNDYQIEEKMKLPPENCGEIFYVILEQIEKMIGKDIFPIKIRFFVDDVEILFKNPMKCEYFPVKKYDPLFTQLAQKYSDKCSKFPNKNERLYFYNWLEYEKCEDTETGEKVKLIGYDSAKKIYLEMYPHDIKEKDIVDLKIIETSPMNSVDFFYRGMRVINVYASKQIQYPCWKIKAYGYFGNAEEYLAISRNEILSDKIEEVRTKISECADDILFKFWGDICDKYSKSNGIKTITELLINDPKKELPCEQINALTLSLLYQQVISLYTKEHKNFISQSDSLLKELLNRSNLRISTVTYTLGILTNGVSPLKKGFNKLSDCWFLRAEDMAYIPAYMATAKISKYEEDNGSDFLEFKENSTVIIADIFSEYLLERKFIPKINKLGRFMVGSSPNKEDPRKFFFVYKFKAEDSIKNYISDSIAERFIQKLDGMYDYEDKSKKELDQKDSDKFKEFIESNMVFPAFERYEELSVEKLPIKDTLESKKYSGVPYCPEYMEQIGNYIILPFNYKKFNEWKEEGDKDQRTNIKNDIIKNIKEYSSKNLTFYQRSRPLAQIFNYIAKENNMQINEIGDKYCKITEDLFEQFEEYFPTTKTKGEEENGEEN